MLCSITPTVLEADAATTSPRSSDGEVTSPRSKSAIGTSSSPRRRDRVDRRREPPLDGRAQVEFDEAAGGPLSAPPVFHTGLVSRPRLVRQLLDARHATTALVCAPPGYGKTALLAEWIERDERPCAWITLTERHSSPAVLGEAIMRALDALEPVASGLLDDCRQAATDRPTKPSPELLGALAATVSSMGSVRAPVILVLDDAHRLRNRAALRVLSTVAAAMPTCSKLALASRSEPPLPLARRRADHELLELGVRELAMTAYEAFRLLRAAGLHADRGAVERLTTKTEGWPAALYLAALSLRAQADVKRAVEEFAGSDRAVSEYVRQELLSHLSKERRAFLRRCSVLDQLSAPLCDEVLERSDSAAVLEEIAFQQRLLLPLDTAGNWYRCNPLVRDVLRTELRARDGGLATALSHRASRWFEQCGDIDRAIGHAVDAGQSERAGELLWRHASAYLVRGSDPRVRRWLDNLSEATVADSPQFALCAAFTEVLAANIDVAERWARTASSAIARRASDDDRTLRGGVALVMAAIGRDGVERMARTASQASSLLGQDSPWNSFCWLVQGVADHICGERARARDRLEAGARLSATVMPVVESLCVAQLAMMDGEDGDWDRAADRAAAAREVVTAHALEHEPLTTLVLCVSAWIAGRQGRGDEAKRDLIQARQLLDRFSGFMPWFEVEARILVARASIRLADSATARASLSRASRVLRRMVDAPQFHTWLDDAWAEIDEHSASALSGPASLTIAELRVLRFLPSHLSFREIGERLNVSTNTVKTQAHAVYGKLGATSRTEGVARASALGLIEASII
jgi:LuxR family maltose regulon positive regulatory protein